MGRAAGLVAIALLLGARPAAADDKPWVTGVSEQAKAAAKELLDKGNAKLVAGDYVAALELYTQAIARWDHPAIRFNMVRCLIQLDRMVEANENLALALKYGAAPLEEPVYREALAYQKLLANEVATVTVRCDQPGVKLTLDGAPFVTCPGEQARKVKPGRHQIVGAKPGFLTLTHDVFVVGGAEEEFGISLAPLEGRGKIVHRWPAWLPWVVVGAGLGVTAVGGLIEYEAYQTMNHYEIGLVVPCFDFGCGPDRPVPENVRDLKDTAQTQNVVGIAVMTVGVATLITGGVLVYMNRARTVFPTAEVAPQGATISLTGRF